MDIVKQKPKELLTVRKEQECLCCEREFVAVGTILNINVIRICDSCKSGMEDETYTNDYALGY